MKKLFPVQRPVITGIAAPDLQKCIHGVSFHGEWFAKGKSISTPLFSKCYDTKKYCLTICRLAGDIHKKITGKMPNNRAGAMRFKYNYESLRRDLTNLSFLRHRRFSGYLVSMHQSGTHWLKHILASAIATDYGFPQPRYAHANEIIGGPKDPIIYPAAPHLASSHTIPSQLLRSRLLRHFFNPPRYVVLVRDMRETLVSNYMKWNILYGCSFSEYLRDFSGIKFHNQIWWCIRFLNAWGDLVLKYPDQHCVIRYEDMCSNTFSQVSRLNDFLGLHLSHEAIRFGISESSREKMKKKTEPGTPQGAGVVSSHNMNSDDIFTAEDRLFLKKMCTLLLRHRFGYDYY